MHQVTGWVLINKAAGMLDLLLDITADVGIGVSEHADSRWFGLIWLR